MTRKIEFIIGIAVTALALGVPTALGEGPLVEQSDAVAYFYANERATLGFGPVIHDHGDATQAKLLLHSPPMGVIRDHGGATQAKLLLHSPPMGVIRDHGDATQAKFVQRRTTSVGSTDEVRLSPNSLSTPTVSTSSGSAIKWPQLGIGFGLGILLVAGLWLAMRMTKGRPLAQ